MRAGEILTILQEGSRNAVQVASQMSWDIDCESWDQFPSSQKWFAIGEAIAHLKYLEDREEVRSEEEAQQVLFSLAL